MYSIAHALYRRYDLVMIGDYTPTNGTAPFDHMKRSMLNQEKIGEFRRILEWVAAKRQKYYVMANERNGVFASTLELKGHTRNRPNN